MGADTYLLVTEGVPETRFGYTKYHRGMGWRHVEEGFSSIFVKYFAYLMIFRSSAAPSVRFTLINRQIYGKTRKKSILQRAYHKTWKTQKPGGFRVPDPSLVLNMVFLVLPISTSQRFPWFEFCLRLFKLAKSLVA